MSEETSEALNALLHIADDHPCCKSSLIWAHKRFLELERENAALRLDKARLDWLDQHSISRLDLVMVHIEWNKISVREAIDAARKEAQP